MPYTLVRGCRPCNFECWCCKEIYSRCNMGIGMYFKGSFNNPDYVLCEYCHGECYESGNSGCVIQEERMKMEAEDRQVAE